MFWLMSIYFLKMYNNFENIIYNYSEARHSKGPADGIGGLIKRTADSIVAHGTDLNNFEVLVSKLREECKNIFFGTVSSEEIDQIQDKMPKKVQPFNGTIKEHQWKWSRLKSNTVTFNEMSCYRCNILEKCKHYHLGEMKFSKDSLDTLIPKCITNV